MKTLFSLFLVAFLAYSANAKSSNFNVEMKGLNVEMELHSLGIDLAQVDLGSATFKEDERLISILLCIALGPFGGHRLYLGTEPQVPVVYTLTLGGGLGILPLIDLFHLIFTKDLSSYRSNSHVFMWRPDEVTPQ